MILFDIVTPKWVLFFKEIINKIGFDKVIVTTRYDENYNETKKLLELHKIPHISIGKYGKTIEEKLLFSLKRQEKLIEIIKKYNIKKVVSGSVVDINRVAFGLGIPIINFNDMPMRGHNDFCKKITHVTKLTAPLSTILFKPFVIPDEIFQKLGVCNIKTYNFLDPLIWLKDFKVDKDYVKKTIPQIDFNKPIVTIREEEFYASYVQNKYSFFYEVIKELENWNINLIIIPRYESTHLKRLFKTAIILEKKIILQNLLAISNLFIGGGGTINIEAAYFGVPVISTRSFISHYDKFLIYNKLMYHSTDKNEIINLAKKLIEKNNLKKAKEIFGKMEVDIDIFVGEINGKY